MKTIRWLILLICLLGSGPVLVADVNDTVVYVPYDDMARLLNPQDKAVLMDRVAFEKLLVTAHANTTGTKELAMAVIKQADYVGTVKGNELHLTGKLALVSGTDQPVSLPLGYAGIGLNQVQLDGQAAPLGFDEKGRLTLIVNGQGNHLLEIQATGKLKELDDGGMQFSFSLPDAITGKMNLMIPGDQDVHSTLPMSEARYDETIDQTRTELIVGGQNHLTVILLGNGRRENDRSLLLGESAMKVFLDQSQQELSCLYTVQVLRRSVRELQFLLPAFWTITQVTCPNLVKWSLDTDASEPNKQKLHIYLQRATIGSTSLHIKAMSLQQDRQWHLPVLALVDATYERGYIVVHTDETLRVHGEVLNGVRREELKAGKLNQSLMTDLAGRLYFHWGANWSARLELASVQLLRSVEGRQRLVVSPEQIHLIGDFEMTAIGRELYEMSFKLPGSKTSWQLKRVQVNQKEDNFEYYLDEQADQRVLLINLPEPVRPEKTAEVMIELQQIPKNWHWSEDSPERAISVALIQAEADNVSGYVSVSARGDLAAAVSGVPESLEAVPVGRMASLGMDQEVQYAWHYTSRVDAELSLRISRQRPRIASDAVGLVHVTRQGFTGDWQVNYKVSRAQVKRLYLLVDQTLGEQFQLSVTGAHINSKEIVTPDENTFVLPEKVAKTMNLWLLHLDNKVIGDVVLTVHYERPLPAETFSIPMIRPICKGQIGEQLAVQAGEELALAVETKNTRNLDAIDLPPLPVATQRILAAWKLEPVTTEAGAAAEVTLKTSVHENYDIPAALAVSGELTTFIDVQGSQRSEAVFRIANAGWQFLTLRLPERAQLWSLSVAGKQAKPQRSLTGDYQIPFAKSRKPITVKLVYAWTPGEVNLKQLELGAVELVGIDMNRVAWNVIGPPVYRIVDQQTNMQTRDMVRPSPAYIQTFNFVAEHFLGGAIFMTSLGRAWEMSKGVQTASHLRGIGQAIFLYQNDFNNQWPDTLERLVDTEDLSENMLYDTQGFRFEYFPPPPGSAITGNTIIAQSSVVVGRRAVLYDDGRVEQVSLGDYIEVDEYAVKAADRIRKKVVSKDRAAGARQQPKPQAEPPQQQIAVPKTPQVLGVRLAGEGRYTLPVDLVPNVESEGVVRFTSLGSAVLRIRLMPLTRMSGGWLVGFLLILVLAMVLLRQRAKIKAVFIVVILCAASLLAIWFPTTTWFANGMFIAGLILLLLYPMMALFRWLWDKMHGDTKIVTQATTTGLICMIFLGMSDTVSAETINPTAPGLDEIKPAALIIPYHGDPTEAEQSDKVLVPYEHYIQLWNQAHPDRPIDQPPPGTSIALSDVQYNVDIKAEQLELRLSATVRTFGRKSTSLALPFEDLAITKATFKDKTAQLQSAPDGHFLLLPGESTGQLQLTAVKPVQSQEGRGQVNLALPPLPAGQMRVRLLQDNDDLVLEVDGIDSPLNRQVRDQRVEWRFPLSLNNQLTLRWMPRFGGGFIDRTLTASVDHQVYAFHWGLVGVSKMAWQFSSDQRDHFNLLLPDGVTLSDVEGPNIKDHRVLSQTSIENQVFGQLEVRLHRAVAGEYALTLRWLQPLPPLNEIDKLRLVRADEVGRESGTVTLHRAGGMELDVAQVQGGRRMDLVDNGENATLLLPADQAGAVAKYYWPYHPFALSYQLSQLTTDTKVVMDQLVRISPDQVQLLTQVHLSAKQGHIFDADFRLPPEYELLSIVGPTVGNYHETTTAEQRILHVNFKEARNEMSFALVLLKRDTALDIFKVPMLAAVSSANTLLANQQGRLAVQVAESLEAQTEISAGLKSTVPDSLKDWLDEQQIQAVQFAYLYDSAQTELRLQIRAKSTRIHTDIFAGLVISDTTAQYTYRLRFNLTGSPIDQLRFSLPSEYAGLAAVESPALRSLDQKESQDQTTWLVSLINEVTGRVDISLNFSLPLDTTTRTLPVPQINVPAASSYSVIMAIQNTSRHDINIKEKANIGELALSEQKRLIPTEIRQSLQYVFQTFESDWSLEFAFTPAKPATRIQAVVDLLNITTVMDRNGHCRYEARIALQNRSEQFLRVKVPNPLRLWSAQVAGQAVKPVLAADGSDEEVLIPLVKTSPGGLPYDIHLYISGENMGPLNGITQLQPPAVEILDLPVIQTTWSLQLPDGYHYIRPGGNMSPVAGTAELLSIGLEARLKQVQRLAKTYRGSSFSSSRKDYARENLEWFNKKVAREIEQAESFLSASQDKISQDDYQRLRSKLTQQKRSQSEITTGHEKYIQQKDNEARFNMTYFLNEEATNFGLDEMTRNQAINVIPEFITENESAQISQLKKELESATEQSQIITQTAEAPNQTAQVRQQTNRGLNAEDLFSQNADQDHGVQELLQGISQEEAKRITQQQAKVTSQLDELADNRMQRLYGSLSKQAQMGGELNRSRVARGKKGDRTIRRKPDRLRAGSSGGMMPSDERGGSKSEDDLFVNGSAEVSGREGFAYAGGSPVYVTAGTYSLPVTLPQGEVRLDFVRPGGDTVLSIWAIPIQTIHNLYGTVGAFLALLTLLGVIKIWPSGTSKNPLSARRFIGYVLTIIVFVLLLGLLGLLISSIVILIIETRRSTAKT